MRVEAVIEVSTSQQQFADHAKNKDSIKNGSNVPMVSFKECLSRHIKDAKSPEAIQDAQVLVSRRHLGHSVLPAVSGMVPLMQEED